MSNAPFLIADTHFNHKKIVEFNGVHGTKLRPWTTVEEMNEAFIGNWNSVVPENGKVYILGDAGFGKTGLEIFRRLNGKHCLIKGNHDIRPLDEYLEHFYDIRGSHHLGDFVLTHIPIHPDSLSRYKDGNIHGHLHDGRVMLNGEIDKRYICVSAEHTNFTPISFNQIESLR